VCASGRCVQTVITGSALLAISGTEEQYVSLYRQTEELNGVVLPHQQQHHQQSPPHTAAAAATASSTLPQSLAATAAAAAPAAAQQHALIRGTGRTPGIRSTATSTNNSNSSTSTLHNDWGLSAVRHDSTSTSNSGRSSSSSVSAAVQKAAAGRDVVIADLGGLLFERRYNYTTLHYTALLYLAYLYHLISTVSYIPVSQSKHCEVYMQQSTSCTVNCSVKGCAVVSKMWA
jgi:hypothetical protein